MSLHCINDSLAETQPTISERYECRICLTFVQGRSPTYCGCKGYSKNVHLNCLLEWVKRRATQKNISRRKVDCQICKEDILLEVKARYSCYSCLDIVRQNLNENHCDFKTKLQQLLCIFIICAIILGILCQIHSQTSRQSIVYGIITMSVIMGVCLLVIIGSYFIRRRYELTGIKGREEEVGRGARVAPIFGEDY